MEACDAMENTEICVSFLTINESTYPISMCFLCINSQASHPIHYLCFEKTTNYMTKQLMQFIAFLCLMPFLVMPLEAQKIVYEGDFHLSAPNQIANDIKQIIPITSNEEKLILLIQDEFTLNVLTISSDFSKGTAFKCSLPPEYHHELVSYQENEGILKLYFGNRKKNRFVLQQIDLEKETQFVTGLSIKFQKELYLTSHVSGDGKFHLLTIVKNSSKIKHYILNDSRLIDTKLIDLSDYKFSKDNLNYTLYHVLHQNAGYKKKLGHEKIDTEQYVNLETAAKKIKVLTNENHIYLSLDHEYEQTHLITLDLVDQTHSVDAYPNTPPAGYGRSRHTNSIMIGDGLFQLNVSPRYLSVKSINTSSKEIQSTYVVTSDDPKIPFKNGLVKFNEDFEPDYARYENEGTETQKVLRRMLDYRNIGMSVNHEDDQVTLKVGAYKERETRSGGSSGGLYTPGSTISTPYGTVSTPGSFSAGSFGVSEQLANKVYFLSVFNKNTHKRIDDFATDPFEAIEKYREDPPFKPTAEAAFQWGDQYLYGYYLKKKKVYVLRQFGSGIFD